MKRVVSFVAGIVLLLPLCLRADELKLKDGTKITGTIVGFEDNSFKVKTNYGYAVVQKDEVVSISMADTAKKPDPAKQSDAKASDAAKRVEPISIKQPPSAKTQDAPPLAATRTVSGEEAAVAEPKSVPTRGNSAGAAPAAPIAASDVSKPSSARVASVNSATVPTAGTPPEPAMPEPIREEVVGNSYVNETYGFRMYKPPDWELIAGARTLLPGAIAAMGTGDQTTYLLIGQDTAAKSVAKDMDATEARLRDVMDNFRPLGEKRITVSGSDAVERRFRGSVDEHDWSGTVVLIPRGAKVYTIFGMTYADSDLVQIQENVIARAIASLQFTSQ